MERFDDCGEAAYIFELNPNSEALGCGLLWHDLSLRADALSQPIIREPFWDAKTFWATDRGLPPSV
jgi:hypothetical protein